jgi:RNA polymerase sigma factor (sigma-70 family)
MEPNGCVGSVDGVTPTFDEFWTAQRDRIGRALAMTVGDLDLATDAVDEAMARAYQRWDRVATLDNPAGWVYRVGLNWTRSLHRRRRRTPPAWLASPASSTDAYGLDPSIDAAMAALPESRRSVVVCRLLLGWSEAQTAVALGLRPGTVKSRLSRAVDELAVTLEHLNPKEDIR